MRFNPREILDWVKAEGFEKVWIRSGEMLPKEGEGLSLEGKGKPHQVQELIQKIRAVFLSLGFDEAMTPVIVEDEEVYRQYGPEAPVILDRCYYLATLPRPDIGLSVQKCQMIEDLDIRLDERKKNRLQGLLRDYKRGAVGADDLVEKMAETLETTDSVAIRVVREVFPEFAALKPVPTGLTLRAHLTSSWFGTLKALQHRTAHPIKLFSVGIRFRREQSEDTTHLRAHYGASCVVLDGDVSAEDGKRITEAILEAFNFEKVRFVRKKATSKYYAPGTEYEGFVQLPGTNRWIEVVDFGLYSPIALANYSIGYPVLNVGFGVERLAMLRQGEEDIRRVAYPQLYGEWELTDEELAGMVRVSLEPRTVVGRAIREAIVKTATAHADSPSPCEFVTFEGNVLGKKVRVSVYERDVGVRLLGPAALNKIYVYRGDILGIPEGGMDEVGGVREAREKGFPTGISYLDALAALVAAGVEAEAVRGEPRRVDVRVRLAKQPSDVNVGVEEAALYYITGRRRRIFVKGPVFLGVKAEFLE